MRQRSYLFLVPFFLSLSGPSVWANEDAFFRMLEKRGTPVSCGAGVGHFATEREFLGAQKADNLESYTALETQFRAAVRNGTEEAEFQALVQRAAQVYENLNHYLVGRMTQDGANRFLSGEEKVASADRAKYRLSAQDGLFYCLDASGAWNPFETRASVAYTEDRKPIALYVMDEHGDFFASNYQVHGKFHHSSLSAGLPVAVAGGIIVDKGKVTYLSNGSGHYQSSVFQLAQAVHQLEKRGLIGPEGIRIKASIWGQEREFTYHLALAP